MYPRDSKFLTWLDSVAKELMFMATAISSKDGEKPFLAMKSRMILSNSACRAVSPSILSPFHLEFYLGNPLSGNSKGSSDLHLWSALEQKCLGWVRRVDFRRSYASSPQSLRGLLATIQVCMVLGMAYAA